MIVILTLFRLTLSASVSKVEMVLWLQSVDRRSGRILFEVYNDTKQVLP
jgi:hypothetical protein